jgi:hypothetical protein
VAEAGGVVTVDEDRAEDVRDWYAEDNPDGAQLLDAAYCELTRFVVFPSDATAVATTLWIAATHALPAWQHATRLAIRSPQKRCGKSRLLDIIALLSFNPLMSTDISTAVIFRKIGSNDHETPTLLIDEADTLFGTKVKAEQNEDLRGLLNAGFQRGRMVWRCVGPEQTPNDFNTFSMAALAAIKMLPDTIVDRAVSIDLKRRQSGETVDRFRIRRDTKPLIELRKRLTGWLRDSELLKKMGDTEPGMPDSVEDRQQDAWEPLIVVADVAGGHWRARARAACKELCGHDQETDDEMQLLSDIEAIFKDTGSSEFIPSQQLVNELRDIEESPWKDRELTPHKLSKMLKPYGVKPRHNAAKTQRGYHRADFKDAFTRSEASRPSRKCL